MERRDRAETPDRQDARTGAPRVLARLCLSFSIAAALCVFLLSGWQMLALGALGLLGGLTALLRRRALAGAVLLAVMAGAWLSWLTHFHLVTLDLGWAGRTVELTAVAQDYPRPTGYGYALEVCALGPLDGERLLLYLDAAEDIRPGDALSATVSLDSAGENASGPTLSYWADVITLRGSAEGLEVNSRGTPWYLLPRVWAHALAGELDRLFPEEEASFLLALATGERGGMPQVLTDDLRDTGLSHIVAASGLHISLLIAVLRLLPGSQKTRSLLLLPCLLAFAALAGFTPSICRAALMQAVSLFAPLLGREEDPPTSLALALAMILSVNPMAAASVSLQLSFAAMLGLMVLCPPIFRRLERLPRPLRGAGMTVGTTLAATAFTLPLVLWYFGESALIGPLANLLVLWTLPLLLPLALICPLAGLACPALGELLAIPAFWAARGVLALIHALADIPFAALRADQPRVIAWLMLGYAVAALWGSGLLRGRARPLSALLLAGSLVLALLLQAGDRAGIQLEIALLDVGQGQCILLTNGGQTAVIDCGSSGGGSAARLRTALARRGLGEIDHLILTHWDSDHTNGVPELLGTVPVHTLHLPGTQEEAEGDPSGMCAAAAACGAAVCWVEDAGEIALSNAALTLLPMDSDQGPAGAVLVTAGDFSLLVTGDLDLEEEAALAARYHLSPVDVLVGGHHGSRYATGEALLDSVRPQAVLFSAGANPYGHPTGEALARAAAAGARIFRTDLQGEIVILLPG